MHKPTKIVAFVTAALAAATLIACGGGGDEGTSETASVRRQSASVAESIASAVMPGDSGWGTQEACAADSDFVAIDGSADPDISLKSRHVYCLLLTPYEQEISVDLMRNANDNGWELYKRSAGRPATTFTLGKVVLTTRFQAFGPAVGLNKIHKMRYSVQSFVPDPGFPLSTSGLQLKLAPRMSCDTYSYGNGSSNGVCTNLTSFGATVPLQSGGSVETAAVSVGFAWNHDASVSDPYDWASFKVSLNGFEYTVNGSERPVDSGVFYISSDSSDGAMVAQEIRCDRKVVGLGSGNGCVMPRAAAVYVMDAIKDPGLKEAAEHVYDAQRTLSVGQTALAPGRFALKVGTRAVADETVGSEYQGLEREVDEVLKSSNRNAACQSATSLYALRPYQGSATCPTKTTANCSCDEYPFAATKSGGAYAPDATSVKGINGDHNNLGGSKFSGFLTKERVMPPAAYYEKFWVEAKK